jgi:hypothetical protein
VDVAQRAIIAGGNRPEVRQMWARVARFEGDPADVDERISRLQAFVDGGVPAELADARFLLCVDRASGAALGITVFPTEEAMRRADEVMNRGTGHAGRRSAVEFYEVPVHTL